jgi:hypothetical protein
MVDSEKIGIVVPTLGQRTSYLLQSLDSIRNFANSYILIVGPEALSCDPLFRGKYDKFIVDTREGLSSAINIGFENLPNEIQFITWLGDDDLLEPQSGYFAIRYLQDNADSVLAYGKCNYIDADGRVIGTNNAGQWAARILRFGPDLIPQPGAIFRRDAFCRTGGLDSELGFAFDFDLFIKLSKLGKLKFIPIFVSRFRWHSDSKSVGIRKESVREASRVRMNHLPPLVKPLAFLWEIPVMILTYFGGHFVTKKAERIKLNSK